MSSDEPIVIPRDCITCDGPGCSAVAPQKRCSRCRVSYYCSKDCQISHYKAHKVTCRRLAGDWKLLDRTFPVIKPVNEECGICLEVHPENRVINPACRHGFCFKCLDEWHNMPANMERNTTCPTCRIEISQRVVDDVLDRARYLGKLSAAANTKEKKDALLQEAFAELDKLLSFTKFEGEFRPLLVKVEILKDVGEPQRAMEELGLLQDKLKEADKNMDKFESLAAEIEQNPFRCEQAMREVEAMKDEGVPLRTDHPDQLALEVDLRIAGTEAWADLGEHEFAVTYFTKLMHEETLNRDQSRRVAMGRVSSQYSLGRLDTVREFCLRTFEKGRVLAAVYKYLALAQRDMGEFETARDTLNRGLLYSVMDQFEKAELMALYKELVQKCS